MIGIERVQKSVYDLPVLYFYSEARELSSVSQVPFVRQEQKAGRIIGECGWEGLRLDFNAGVRLRVPHGDWHIVISDSDSEQVFFDADVSGKTLVSMEKYFIRWKVEAFLEGRLVFSHVLDLGGQTVYIEFPQNLLGDSILLLPYVEEFQKIHGCRVLLNIAETFHPIVREYYPAVTLYDGSRQETYASYWLGAFQKDWFMICDDARTLPADYIPRLILDLPRSPAKRLWEPTSPRQIQEPYACIAVQASSARKSWLYPGGWDVVVEYLKSLKYRVLCIDKERETVTDGYRVALPEGAEDYTGNLPLLERVNLLAYADLFIGLPSGLSWLADMAGCQVVLISGITMPYAEFDTPYRVINRLVCHGCYNDMSVDWHDDFCPYHHGTERECECSKKISPRQVIAMIDRLRSDRRR